MSRPARSQEEVERIKENILHKAVELINLQGFENFNMRKLGNHIGIAAKTVYNYYQNKDELYLTILAKGFRDLYVRCRNAYYKGDFPLERLEAMAREYMEFGISQSNYYNLMFTWQVPKYQDYAETSLEPLARVELNTSLELLMLFVNAVREVRESISEQEARFYVIYFWSLMHGYLSGYNNTLLNYMHENPLSLKNRIFNTLMENIQHEIITKAGK